MLYVLVVASPEKRLQRLQEQRPDAGGRRAPSSSGATPAGAASHSKALLRSGETLSRAEITLASLLRHAWNGLFDSQVSKRVLSIAPDLDDHKPAALEAAPAR